MAMGTNFFSFNLYSSLLLPAFLQGLLFTFLCFWRYRRDGGLADLFLALLLFCLTVRLSFWMLGFAGWYDRQDSLTTLMFYFPFNTLALMGPCLYFYFHSLTNRDFKFGLRYWSHLILPFLLLLLCLFKFIGDFAYYQPFPVNDGFQFGTRGPLAQLDKLDSVYAISYASVLFYLAIVIRRFRHYREYLLQHFSGTEQVKLNWLRNSLWFTALTLSVFFVFYVLGFAFHLSYGQNWLPYLLLGVVIYYLGINGYEHHPEHFRHLQFTGRDTVTNVAPQMPELENWKVLLSELMEVEMPYLDADLSLSRLAQKLQTNPQAVSRIINDGYGQNFNDYINGLRVDAVIRQFSLKAQQRYSLMGIAYDCGFNAKTTFNRAFKKATGLTPSAYLQKGVPNDDMNLLSGDKSAP